MRAAMDYRGTANSKKEIPKNIESMETGIVWTIISLITVFLIILLILYFLF